MIYHDGSYAVVHFCTATILAPLRGNYQPRRLDLTRDVRQLPCTSSYMDGTIRQGAKKAGHMEIQENCLEIVPKVIAY